MSNKPTIRELEEILASDSPGRVSINPDGSVSVVDEHAQDGGVSVDDAEVMRLWRQAGLPEYFLGNGGTNDKLVVFASLIAAVAPAPGGLREALEKSTTLIELMSAALDGEGLAVAPDPMRQVATNRAALAAAPVEEVDQDSLPTHEDVCGILGPPLMSAPDELRELRQTISAAHDATLEAVRLQEDALGRVQSLIKAHAAAPVDGWLPMETAPKDRPLLLFARCKTAIASGIVVGWWIDDLGWIECCFDGNSPVGLVPTHWQRLPAFPAAPVEDSK